MKVLRHLSVVFILTAAFFVAAGFLTSKSLSSSLVEIARFGENPGNLRMFVYVPDNVKVRPPILVVAHWCSGSARAIFSATQFAALADQYGYIVVYPSVTRSGFCFDVSSRQSLKRGGGSDPVSIMSMVTYAIKTYGGDPHLIYVTGLSSGAMMTNVLLGNYPDVFKAGSVFAGVPFGCFATIDGSLWNNACSNGQLIKTPQEWGDSVRESYPDYVGSRPRIQLWHGTADTDIAYPNFGEQIKQWTNVHGISQIPDSTDYPQKGFTRTRYTNSKDVIVVEAISERDVTHSIAYNEVEVLRFFDLDSRDVLTFTSTTTDVSVSGQ